MKQAKKTDKPKKEMPNPANNPSFFGSTPSCWALRTDSINTIPVAVVNGSKKHIQLYLYALAAAIFFCGGSQFETLFVSAEQQKMDWLFKTKPNSRKRKRTDDNTLWKEEFSRVLSHHVLSCEGKDSSDHPLVLCEGFILCSDYLKLLDLGRFVERDLIFVPIKGKIQISSVKDHYSAKQTSKEGVLENMEKIVWDKWYETNEKLSAQNESFFKGVAKTVAGTFSAVVSGTATQSPTQCVSTFKLLFVLNSELVEFVQRMVSRHYSYEFCCGKNADGTEILELIVSSTTSVAL
jgi:hypothetical protein